MTSTKARSLSGVPREDLEASRFLGTQDDKVRRALAGILHLSAMALLAVHAELPIFTSLKWTLLQRI